MDEGSDHQLRRLERQAGRLAGGELDRRGAVYHRPGRRVALADEDRDHWTQVRHLLRQSPSRPPRVVELAETLSLDPRETEALLNRLAGLGLAIRVTRNRYYLAEALLA